MGNRSEFLASHFYGLVWLQKGQTSVRRSLLLHRKKVKFLASWKSSWGSRKKLTNTNKCSLHLFGGYQCTSMKIPKPNRSVPSCEPAPRILQRSSYFTNVLLSPMHHACLYLRHDPGLPGISIWVTQLRKENIWSKMGQPTFSAPSFKEINLC